MKLEFFFTNFTWKTWKIFYLPTIPKNIEMMKFSRDKFQISWSFHCQSDIRDFRQENIIHMCTPNENPIIEFFNFFFQLLKGRHMMVRVGGGWDTLENFLARHDPCQSFSRSVSRTGSPLPPKNTNNIRRHSTPHYRSSPVDSLVSR